MPMLPLHNPIATLRPVRNTAAPTEFKAAAFFSCSALVIWCVPYNSSRSAFLHRTTFAEPEGSPAPIARCKLDFTLLHLVLFTSKSETLGCGEAANCSA